MYYVEEEGLDQIVRRLQKLSPRLRAAAHRAVRKTVTKTYSDIIRKGASAADINQRGLRKGIEFPRGKRVHRRDINARKRSAEASVYIGYNPLKSHYVGKIKKWRRGQTAQVRQHRFPGAFVARFKSGYEGIFKRAGGKWVEQKVKIDPVAQAAKQIEPGVATYLKGVLANELTIELRKAGAL